MDDQLDKKHPIVSVLQSATPANKATKVTIDDSFARIVVYEKEDLTNEEIYALLNVRQCIKIDVDKHYVRSKEGEDKHSYTIYNILI
jgi:hypothetical protein